MYCMYGTFGTNYHRVREMRGCTSPIFSALTVIPVRKQENLISHLTSSGPLTAIFIIKITVVVNLINGKRNKKFIAQNSLKETFLLVFNQ